jgi:UDP-N-acetyl-D-glucosamine/UDP-N-acetyl-D-galactosamine dehydrogenase
MLPEIVNKSYKLAVIGLGYVGLPVAIAFSKKISVIGYDSDAARIQHLNQHRDPNKEIPASDFELTDLEFTRDPASLHNARVFIITVPTPVNASNKPDLKYLLDATSLVGKYLKKGDFVIYESTTFPGCTEEECIPLLEKISGLTIGKDFKAGYSPERINPGDANHQFINLPKVVSATDADALREILELYKLVVKAPLHAAASIRIAEASKILENTQRDVNIALMNEMSLIFDRMGIDSHDVFEAAAGKWNFLPFKPGLVGGHCTGVDPYYLIYKSLSLGYAPTLIQSARQVNDGMALHVANRVLDHVKLFARHPKVLVKGITFKENVSDLRNAIISDTIRELLAHGVKVEVEDPMADPLVVEKQYGFPPVSKPADDYDAVIITVQHAAYEQLNEAYYCSITKEQGLIADLKGIYRNRIHQRKYWTL